MGFLDGVIGYMFLATQDAAKSDMAGWAVDRLCVARGGAVALAIAGRAQVRAAFQYFSSGKDMRHRRIMAFVFAATAWIMGNAAGRS